MTDSTAGNDKRIHTIIKELLTWHRLEFDVWGHPVRSLDHDDVEPQTTCPSTMLDNAVQALKDMQEWARLGRLLDAQRDQDALTRECCVDDD